MVKRVIACHTYNQLILADDPIYCDRSKTLFDCDIQKILGALRHSVESVYSEIINHSVWLIMERYRDCVMPTAVVIL